MIRNCDLLDTPCADLVARMTGCEVSDDKPAQRFVNNWVRDARNRDDGWDVTIVHRPGNAKNRLRVVAEKMFGLYCELNKKFGRADADVDFAGWLIKRADFALWVPAGTPVQLADGTFAGVVTGVADDSTGEGAYSLVAVDTAKGVLNWRAWQLARANIPQSILDYAKHVALADFKCPMMKGERDGRQSTSGY